VVVSPSPIEALLLLDLTRGAPKLTAVMRLSHAPGQARDHLPPFEGVKRQVRR
jgi:hypothetical protein